MAQVDAVSGLLWQEGCGPEVTEAYLSGTEPREMCGCGFMGDQMMAAFEEPGMISEQQAMEMSADEMAMGHRESQVVDPADTATADKNVTVDEPDTVRVEQRQPPPPPTNPRDTIPKKDSLSTSR